MHGVFMDAHYHNLQRHKTHMGQEFAVARMPLKHFKSRRTKVLPYCSVEEMLTALAQTCRPLDVAVLTPVGPVPADACLDVLPPKSPVAGAPGHGVSWEVPRQPMFYKRKPRDELPRLMAASPMDVSSWSLTLEQCNALHVPFWPYAIATESKELVWSNGGKTVLAACSLFVIRPCLRFSNTAIDTLDCRINTMMLHKVTATTILFVRHAHEITNEYSHPIWVQYATIVPV